MLFSSVNTVTIMNLNIFSRKTDADKKAELGSYKIVNKYMAEDIFAIEFPKFVVKMFDSIWSSVI